MGDGSERLFWVGMFRRLRADEIELRVGSVMDGAATLLLYQNARAAMDILDETVGPLNWQRVHTRENQNCKIGIYNQEIGEWVWKEDVGTPSNTEQEKGLASDSFKRAAVNWGIGRELYSAPRIRIECETKRKENGYGYELKNKWQFWGAEVRRIEYGEDGKIEVLEIWQEKGRGLPKIIFNYNTRSGDTPDVF